MLFLKNRFLNTSAMLHAMDGEKSAAELERESIQIETLKPDEKEEEDEKDDKTGDNEGDNEGGETDETGETSEEKDEETEVEETAEEKAIREADEAANADKKTKRQLERMQKRIDTLTAQKRTSDTEKAELKKLLDAKKEDGTLALTEEEVERRAELKAQEKIVTTQFNKAVKFLASEATKLDKDFQKNINTAAEEVGGIPPVMIGILEDLENEAGKKVGPEVLVHLAKNVDEYEDVYNLSEGKMALKLQAIANKITKKAAKPISRVPAPNTPVGGGKARSQLNDQMSDEDWIKQREAETGGGFRKKA